MYRFTMLLLLLVLLVIPSMAQDDYPCVNQYSAEQETLKNELDALLAAEELLVDPTLEEEVSNRIAIVAITLPQYCSQLADSEWKLGNRAEAMEILSGVTHEDYGFAFRNYTTLRYMNGETDAAIAVAEEYGWFSWQAESELLYGRILTTNPQIIFAQWSRYWDPEFAKNALTVVLADPELSLADKQFAILIQSLIAISEGDARSAQAYYYEFRDLGGERVRWLQEGIWDELATGESFELLIDSISDNLNPADEGTYVFDLKRRALVYGRVNELTLMQQDLIAAGNIVLNTDDLQFFSANWELAYLVDPTQTRLRFTELLSGEFYLHNVIDFAEFAKTTADLNDIRRALLLLQPYSLTILYTI